LGADIRAYRPARSEAARLAKLLETHRIDIVIDVGSNSGQYARHLRSIGYKGRIVCFEPLLEAFGQLTKYARKDCNVTIAPRMALGERTASVSINVAANSESSSLLSVSDTHISLEPLAKSIGNETVPLNRLDDVVFDYLLGSNNIFLKIDVQGYEMAVLRGASELLRKAKGIQLELSLEPLYSDETLYREMIDYVESLGFQLFDINPCFSDDKTGKTFQVDGVFFRNL
ncbi:MAG: FkbM family methyltransferase, partial [Desulfuromonadaceae bacterium]|nr:FkbM family methyltransferase [Desulfuromonadaceae bacterium]